MTISRLVLSSGEPAGIGPDLALIIAQKDLDCELVVLGCPTVFAQRAEQLGLTIDIQNFDKSQAPSCNKAGVLKLIPIASKAPVHCGELDSRNAAYVLEILDTAIALCLDGTFHGMVTAPVQKSVINDAGIAFSGHTEYLAEHTHTERVVMMLATEELRVALATTHLPLKDVAAAITQPLLKQVITILHNDLKKFWGIQQPRILIAGLNPHAGEGGHLGYEEIDTIIPVIEALQKDGLVLKGPLPADTLFTPKYLANADAVLAMYHDQGLPVLKYQGFGRAANITLGLPIVRTSVDHGTALDLAGTGNIDTGSLLTAIKIAQQMAKNHG